jgi:predicted lipid-binding transport protein (Tim44 family)
VQVDLILYALVAAGLVFWLRSLLGTRHGDERERPNPFATQAAEAAAETSVTSLPYAADGMNEKTWTLPKNVSIAGSGVESALLDLSRQDPDFNVARFSQGAQDAFVLIVEAFAAGDIETLESLLEPPVFEAFNQAITERTKNGETMSTEIHAVRKVEILEAKTENRVALITLRFVADETCVIRDKNGAIISGDPDRITEMNDIWTFARPVKSRDPKWLLRQTRDGDVTGEEKTPVPHSV